MKYTFLFCLLTITSHVFAQQKRPLTHADYDKWESLTERQISPDGKLVLYTINPQEGDGVLYIKEISTEKLLLAAPRGYAANFTYDNKQVVYKIKPLFKDTREAKIKKKRPEDMPKDSMGIYYVGADTAIKIPKVKQFKTAQKAGVWLAYLLEKATPEKPKVAAEPDSVTLIANTLKLADSLKRMADSITAKTKTAQIQGLNILKPKKSETKSVNKPVDEPFEEGTELVLKNLTNGEEKKFQLTTEFYFDKYGKKLLVETSKKNGDSTKKALVLWHNLQTAKTDTVLKAFNDAKNYAISEDANQLSFVAERDSVAKALQKFYKLYHYKNGADSAALLLDKLNAAIPKQHTISPDFNNQFSKDGKFLYYAVTPIRKPKDTTLADFETARLDIWHYNDDYLQPAQLVNLNNELKRSYTAVYNTQSKEFIQLGNDSAENIQLVSEGNAPFVVATSTKGYRKASQWNTSINSNAYIIPFDKSGKKTIYKGKATRPLISPSGKFVLWYDREKKNYFIYDIATGLTKNATSAIKYPLYDEDDDHPDLPDNHGFVRWHEKDEAFYIYDKYDIWKCSSNVTAAPVNITSNIGRKIKNRVRLNITNAEELAITDTSVYVFSIFNDNSKKAQLLFSKIENVNTTAAVQTHPKTFTNFRQAALANSFLYAVEAPQHSAYLSAITTTNNFTEAIVGKPLSTANKLQDSINWYTTELVKWKMFDGKMSEGILYKPENFDANKKYPIIFYFYERDADDLYNYRSAAPSASTVNIPYFTSNGYLVFDPNIYYKNGEPGQSAYNSVVSAAKHLAKTYSFVDSTKMAIQGQSWGGYQVAYLVTRTNMFAAAGAGAPVSNMTSAYGGIRWGTGISRQFQYEKSQSRLGKTLWENRELYIKNSPLFFADKVKTPLLMMHNDKDGAVPWYQGIEYFSALRRLDKKVWMLQYNDEDHNLVERRNRKDLSIRLAQFFDHYLKGAAMPKWMKDGLPATEKGIDWGY
jgi:dipeptidyl aminopeptidase/acylaminoacyl peptidase